MEEDVRMKKKAVVLLAALLGSATASNVFAADIPLETNFSYSKDSDGVITHAYKVGTNDEEAAWNATAYHTQLFQSGQSLTENAVVAKWRGRVNEAYWTAWLGYMENRIRSEATYALMYDRQVGKQDHLWMSYGKEAVDTVLAHRAGIDKDTATFTYLNRGRVDTVVTAALANYTDDNTQQKYGVAVEKRITDRFKVGLHYDYSEADHAASPVYYVPTRESILSVRPEWSVPVGKGQLSFVGEHYLAGQTNGTQTQRKSLDVSFTLGHFIVGEKYQRDVDYHSRSKYITWSSQF